MKGKFVAYVLWPLAKGVQNWLVDRSTACDFTVHGFMSNLIKKSWTDSNHASIGTATPEKTASKKSSNHKVVKMLYENISDKGAILLDK